LNWPENDKKTNPIWPFFINKKNPRVEKGPKLQDSATLVLSAFGLTMKQHQSRYFQAHTKNGDTLYIDLNNKFSQLISTRLYQQ